MKRFRYLFPFAIFAAGLAVVAGIAAGYAGTHAYALAFTAAIGLCYLAGAAELVCYQRATAGLAQAVADLSEAPARLDDWLGSLAPGLRDAVRLRVEGQRVALPGPALTPYLVGLLVLLGMLGTFLGMVATLRGTGVALESAADLQAMRASLAAPVKGLGFAFGTSVAGVATSAMLGLLAALCRRERLRAGQALDARIATTLRAHTPTHQREEAFRLLQRQTEAMPVLVETLRAAMDAMAQQNQALGERLSGGQEAFHARAEAAYARLGEAMERALKQGAADSANAAGAAIQPAVESALAGLARETAAWRESLAQAVQRELQGLGAGFEAAAATAAQAWQAAQEGQQRAGEALAGNLGDALERHAEAVERHAASLLQAVDRSHAQLQGELASRDRERLAAWTGSLESTAAALRAQWEAAGEQAALRQQQACDALAQTARELSEQAAGQAAATVAEVARLAQAAAEGPKAAAGLVAEMRERLADSAARDNASLQEREQLLGALGTLLETVNRAAHGQREAVDGLVAAAAGLLDRADARYSDRLEAESGKMAAAAAQVAAGAADVASLGEAFGAAVQAFGQASDKVTAQLQRIEAAMEKSLARGDEQLAYYVAQAREVIDLNMLSQRQILEDLQRLADAPAAGAEQAA